jgi:hypothetical protein
MMNYKDIKTYGNCYRLRISRLNLIIMIVIFCVITPFTNWMIPILCKKVKRGFNLNLRYEKNGNSKC